jgi:hypothetical protein
MGNTQKVSEKCLRKPWSSIYSTEMFSKMVFEPMEMICGG